MKTIKKQSVSDYIDTPAKITELAKLFPKETRKIVQAFITANNGKEVNRADLLASHYQRLSDSIIQLKEEEEKLQTRMLHRKFFNIGIEGALTIPDNEVGPVHITYHNYQQTTSDRWSNFLWLHPNGGVSYIFLNGLPVNARLYFFLQSWSSGPKIGVASPSMAVHPQGKITGLIANNYDFKWNVVKENKQITVCINTVADCLCAGVDCMLVW